MSAIATKRLRDRGAKRRGGISRARAALSVSVALVLACVAGPAVAYELGHTSITFQDPSRGNRSILTEIYYPANTAGENVPAAGGAGEQFPVVSFGHGFVMVTGAYAHVWEALVPAGFIVALPRTEGSVFPSHAQFAQDLAFVANGIRSQGSNPASIFFERVAASAVVAGHSMGGGAAILAAANATNIQAVASFAAAETNPSAIAAAANVSVPALLFAGSLDCVTPPSQHQIPIYSALASDCKTLVTISGASHCQFAESNFNCNLGEGGCTPPTITRAQQHALVALLLVPWLEFTLCGDGAALDEFQVLLATEGGVTYQDACAGTGVDGGSPGGLMPDAGIPGVVNGSEFIRVFNRPNPFRAGVGDGTLASGTTIALTLAAAGRVSVDVFDTSGRRVRHLLDGSLPRGSHDIEWDGLDDRDQALAPGAYFVRVAAGAALATWSARLLR